MSARLPSGLLVTALLSRVNNAGGLGVVRARGDSQAGAILIIATDRDRTAICERGIGPDGAEALIRSGPASGGGESIDSYWQRRRTRDPDLWVIELDIPDAERFAAETILAG